MLHTIGWERGISWVTRSGIMRNTALVIFGKGCAAQRIVLWKGLTWFLSLCKVDGGCIIKVGGGIAS